MAFKFNPLYEKQTKNRITQTETHSVNFILW